MMRHRSGAAATFLASMCFELAAVSTQAQQADTMTLSEGLALRLPAGYAETIIAPNPVEADLALGTWESPDPDKRATFADGTQMAWKPVRAGRDGWFDDSVMSNCYVYFSFVAASDSVKLLLAMGDEMAYVNGSPRSGNPYGLSDALESWQPGFDYSWLPVALRLGRNELLFRCARGRLKVRLCTPHSPMMLNPKDVTVPDIIAGKPLDAWASIVVINATRMPARSLYLMTSGAGFIRRLQRVPLIQPLSVRKVPFRLMAGAFEKPGSAQARISLMIAERLLDSTTIPLRILDGALNHKETFVSALDSSVQYYGINPSRDTTRSRGQALFLTLHGAGVEAINQSGSYEPKGWGHIVAPTNRRPYGFNWEEWGRADALEALEIVRQRYAIDDSRIYLTGHSMGGHGTWHIGAMYPDRFAALGPSAGWISYWTYRYRGLHIVDTSAVRRMIRRSTMPSETFRFVDNYAQEGVYVLHGSEDDNVPVDESRSMVKELDRIHADYLYHEQPGVGHWWDLSDEPGADCVDWAPMFDFFARHARPGMERAREVHFVTANPGVSSRDNWLTIDAQAVQCEPSSADVRFDPGLSRFSGTTHNVTRLCLDLAPLRARDTVRVALDGGEPVTTGVYPGQKQLWLERREGRWSVRDDPSPALKGSHRYGTFIEAYRNRPLLVFGTKGSPEENAWSFEKARYDAEKLWYQGNASLDVIADVDCRPDECRGRNVILYGNRTTNAAWNDFLSDSPVQVDHGTIDLGGHRLSGDNLCCLFIRPRTGSSTASVGVVSATGIVGFRLTHRIPYLTAGNGLPDCTVMNPKVLTEGDKGIIVTGFFGIDWTIASGEFCWNLPLTR